MLGMILAFSAGVVVTVIALWVLIVAIVWRDPEPWDDDIGGSE